MGEAIGEEIFKGNYPFKSISILAAAFERKIPVTVHVGVSYDIIHEHLNCDGAATGALSFNDLLKLRAHFGHLRKWRSYEFWNRCDGSRSILEST